jgi:nicotinate-nucleotide adenylyltransferase
VHYGHLRLADEIASAQAPVEVRLLPSRDPPHRDQPHADARQRVAMLRLALAEFPAVALDTREIERAGKSYSVLTLEDLRAESPERPLAMIMGVDVLFGLTAWHRWQEVFALAHLLVVARPGVPLAIDRMPPQLAGEWRRRFTTDPAALRRAPAGSIVVQPITPHPISATAIRGALARGAIDEVRGLLPPAVLAYIETHRLYGANIPDAP